MNRWVGRILLGLATLALGACASGNHYSKSQLAQMGTEVAVAPRIAVNLNDGWKFVREDVEGAEETGFDDSSWQSISLPHTWNNLDGEDGGNNYYRGPGWYRRHLNIGPDLEGKSIFLHFGAAGSVARVYVNGKLAGPEHK